MIRPSRTFARSAFLVGALLAAGLLALFLTRPGAAEGTLPILDWDNMFGSRQQYGPSQTGVAPLLLGERYYTPVALSTALRRDDGLPIASLVSLPPGTTAMALHAPPAQRPLSADTILHVNAVVCYQVAGQSLYLSTAEPGPLAQGVPLSIGRAAGTTADGRALYATSITVRQGAQREISRVFNEVSYVENGLIVTLHGELPTEQLIALITTARLNVE
jgi:hypothetical protein